MCFKRQSKVKYYHITKHNCLSCKPDPFGKGLTPVHKTAVIAIPRGEGARSQFIHAASEILKLNNYRTLLKNTQFLRSI